MRVRHAAPLRLKTLDSGAYRAVGAAPAEDQEIAGIGAEYVEWWYVVGDTRDLL